MGRHHNLRLASTSFHTPISLFLYIFSSADFSDMIVQEIIRKYTEKSGSGNKHAALASALGSLTWEKPSYSEFQQLAGYLLDYLYLLSKQTFSLGI